jgi:putative membrane protein
VNVLDFNVLLPVIIGAAIGLPAFSGFLSWIFKKFKNQTIATLTGFIFGSLLILWPWKKEIYLLNDTGLEILNKDGERIVSSYERYLPDGLNSEVLFGIAFFIIGILSIWTIEHFAKTKNKAV